MMHKAKEEPNSYKIKTYVLLDNVKDICNTEGMHYAHVSMIIISTNQIIILPEMIELQKIYTITEL